MDNRIMINDIAYGLEDIEQDAWSRLVRASQNVKNGFHTGVLANQASYGINMRTVVLRKVLPTAHTIICHTDKRSHKVSEIQEQAQVSWLFYDQAQNLQLRMAGTAQIHEQDELANQIWENSGIGSRKIYLAQYAPASPLSQASSGLPTGFEGKNLTEADVAQGRKNFAVISTQIHFIDWLYLNPKGHIRAQFHYKEGATQRQWVSP